jgi:hypothetical protein
MRVILARLYDVPAFTPDTIDAMARALDEACAMLGTVDAHDRETIAMRIIDLASNGVITADALRDRVVAESRAQL